MTRVSVAIGGRGERSHTAATTRDPFRSLQKSTDTLERNSKVPHCLKKSRFGPPSAVNLSTTTTFQRL